MVRRFLGLLDQLVRNSSLVLPTLVITVNFGLSIATEFYSLHNFAYSPDEYSYGISAQLFAQGRLWVPSPEPREFFNSENVLNDGHYYGKYSPGWPILLSLGVRVGAPWLMAPLLGAATMGVIYAAARRHFSVEVANVSMISMLSSPFFLFQSASYFSHASCLFSITLFFYFYLDAWKTPERLLPYVGMGLFAGLGFSIRPFTMLALGVIPAVHLVWTAGCQRRLVPLLWKGLPIALAGLSVTLIPFFVYNHAQTGHALRQPFQVYDPTDHLSFPASIGEGAERIRTHILIRLTQLAFWFLQAPILVFLAWRTKWFQDEPLLRWLVLAWGVLLIAYFGYPLDGGYQYGPRYLYEGLTLLLLASAWALVRIGRVGMILLAVLLAFNGSTFVWRVPRYASYIAHAQVMFETARRANLRNAVVFLNLVSRSMVAENCTRNGVTFDGPVLYVHDLGSRNHELLRRYPGRKPYTYVYDSESDSGRFVPWAVNLDSSD